MDLAITLNDGDIPLHDQLYKELRRSILLGRLAPGQRLPSTRALSASLRISRATVV
jgi:GntR family transcriptional regulator/MocR family aminotransferase